MSKNLTFNSGNKFVEHVLPEPTEGQCQHSEERQAASRDQSTKLRAERDQAQATVSAATQQVADMAVAGKSGKAIGDVLAEAAHARFNIATLNEQLDIRAARPTASSAANSSPSSIRPGMEAVPR